MTRAARGVLPCLLLVLGVTALAFGQGQQPDPNELVEQRLRLDVDPHELAKDLSRADDLLRRGKPDEAISLLDRLLKDSRAQEGLFVAKAGPWEKRTLRSFDREVRAKLLQLTAVAREAYESAHGNDAARLAERGRDDPGSFAELLARYPACTRAPRAALLLAECELELGEADEAAFHLEEAATDFADRLEPADLARARRELAFALALAGRRGEADRALDKLGGDDLAVAKAGVAVAERSRESLREPPVTVTAAQVAWVHETLDAYDDPEPAYSLVPEAEPVLDCERAYFHDGSHLAAISLETGKLAFRSALRPGDDGSVYLPPRGPCRLALGPSTVVCLVPLGGVVSADRTTGSVLARATVDELRAAAKIDDEATLAPALAVTKDVVVVGLVARHAEDELWLLGLDTRTLSLRWKTFLVSEQADPEAPEPVISAGPDCAYVLTCRGVVAEIEPWTGGIVWLRRYASDRDDPRRILERRAMPFRGRGFGPPVPEPRKKAGPRPPWLRRGFVGFVHGKVLVAAPDFRREDKNDHGHVLALYPNTGEDAWETRDQGGIVLGPLGDGLLELDAGGTLALVSRSVDVKARIKDAKLVGRPAIAGQVVLLPLEGGLVKVDLAHDGRVEVFSDWKITGDRPANVACSQGRIVAAGVARAIAFAETKPVPIPAFADARALCLGLAHRSFAVREAAQAKLKELGSQAKDELAEAAGSADPEQRHRARVIRSAILKDALLAEWRPLVKEEW